MSYSLQLMHCLFLDLASHHGLLACVTEDAVRASRAVDHRIGDHELVPLIETVLKEAGWNYPDLTQIACVTGPGGFTSLRVAVTCANVLADQLGIPSAGVHLSELYRERSVDSDQRSDVYWLHSTKKDQLFVRGGQWKDPSLVLLGDLLQQLPKKISWCGELIEEQAKSIGAVAEIAESPLRKNEDILPKFLANLRYENKPLEPWYGRGY